MNQKWKDAVSAGRKKFLAENPDKHPWKKRNLKSVPCENVKRFLTTQGMNFVEEFSPIPNRSFSVDIAFPDIKYGIEVNGNQHYNRDGSLKPYYAERHRIFEDHGWVLLELHYSLCFDDALLEKIITVRHTTDYTEFIRQHLEKKLKPKRRTRAEFTQDQHTKLIQKWSQKAEEIRNSNIDFQKFGWVQKVADILPMSPQRVGKWVRTHLPDIYETAFKTKRNKAPLC